MKKNRLSEPDIFNSADGNLQKNLAESIPVFLILGLCLFAVNIFSNQSYLLNGYLPSVSTGIIEKYAWITGSPRVREGLYRLTPEQLAETFPELLPLVTKTSTLPGFDSSILAIKYESGLPQAVVLPPAVANIFFLQISINRAGKEILSTLPGIGTVLAERIVHRREEKGLFRSKDELLYISGIGPHKLTRLVDNITLD